MRPGADRLLGAPPDFVTLLSVTTLMVPSEFPVGLTALGRISNDRASIASKEEPLGFESR